MFLRSFRTVLVLVLVSACDEAEVEATVEIGSAPPAIGTGEQPAGAAQIVAVTEPAPAALTALVPNIAETYQASLQNVATQLNARYVMPTQLTLATKNCGVPNAFYNPQTHEAAVCWEILQVIAQGLQQEGRLASETEWNNAWQTIFSVWTFFLYHEIGHAMIHLYQLPATGREEDAVDQVATLMELGGGEEGMQQAAQAAMAMMSFETLLGPTPAWDEHAMGAQRMTNIICWLYGSAPAQNQDVVGAEIADVGPILPPERAARCESEFQSMNRAWTTLLTPHMRQ